MSEVTQLEVLFALTSVGFLALLIIVVSARCVRVFGTGSARFTTASASTKLVRKIRRLVAPGVEILMPGGQGTYPLTLSSAKRRKWESKIEEWLKLGVRFTLIITNPNDEAKEYWQKLLDRLSPNLKVYILDRKLASSDDATEIQRFDTFHSVLIVKDNEPLGMWIENHHPPKSRVAHNVEYVAAKDIVRYQRARFDRFLRVIRRLTDESRQPPHLETMSSNKGRSSTVRSPVAQAA